MRLRDLGTSVCVWVQLCLCMRVCVCALCAYERVYVWVSVCVCDHQCPLYMSFPLVVLSLHKSNFSPFASYKVSSFCLSLGQRPIRLSGYIITTSFSVLLGLINLHQVAFGGAFPSVRDVTSNCPWQHHIDSFLLLVHQACMLLSLVTVVLLFLQGRFSKRMQGKTCHTSL